MPEANETIETLDVSKTKTHQKRRRSPKKPRRPSVIKYPATVSVAITRPMLDSVLRLCPKNSPDNQSAYLRRLLHQTLLAVDPQYRAAMGNGHDQGGNHDA